MMLRVAPEVPQEGEVLEARTLFLKFTLKDQLCQARQSCHGMPQGSRQTAVLRLRLVARLCQMQLL